MPTNEERPQCYCGNTCFFDFDEGKWLCPARFDGTHTPEQDHAHMQARLKRLNDARLAGSIGGQGRAAALTPARRTAIATHAAKTRWNKGTNS